MRDNLEVCYEILHIVCLLSSHGTALNLNGLALAFCHILTPQATDALSNWENELGSQYLPHPLRYIQLSPLNHVCVAPVDCSGQIMSFAKCHKTKQARNPLNCLNWRIL